MREIDILKKQLAREKRARKEAESIAELKSRVLYQINLELTTLSNSLSDKEKNTRAILEATADGIIVLDNNYSVVISNHAACQLFNYPSDELYGKKITDLVAFIKFEKSSESIAAFLERHKDNVLHEFIALRKDKTTFPVELAISKIVLTQSSSIICVVRNIYERKQAEQRITVQHEIVRILAENTSLEDVAPKIIIKMCETLQLEAGVLWRVDRIDNVLRCASVCSVNNKDVKEFSEVVSRNITFAPGIGLPGRVWQNKVPSWINDVKRDANFPRAEWAKKAGLQSAFAFPIVFEDEVFGILEFFMKHFYPFEDNILRLLNDIHKQMEIFIEREQAQKRVAILSRLAGMSEVASSVLHNVGNTLNSINTSIDMIAEKINHSKMDNIKTLADLLQQHKNNLGAFIENDPQGKHTAQFISLLSEEWNKEKKYFSNESQLLKKNVKHVKKIIEMQQSLSHAVEIRDEIIVEELIEDALALYRVAYEHAGIKIVRNITPVGKATLDGMKLLQIIENLVKNGIDALVEGTIKLKELIINLHEHDPEHFMIQVKDNGIGIKPTKIKKIFAQGYTTKDDGHGFGLHSSALFVKELGGELFAESKGLGFGTTFTLILPYKTPLKK